MWSSDLYISRRHWREGAESLAIVDGECHGHYQLRRIDLGGSGGVAEARGHRCPPQRGDPGLRREASEIGHRHLPSGGG